MTYNVTVHLILYLLAGLHVLAGSVVGGIYLRILLRTPTTQRIALHARHVVPVSFGWAAVVFAQGYRALLRFDFASPVLWTDYLLLAGLLSMAVAIAVLAREVSFWKAVE